MDDEAKLFQTEHVCGAQLCAYFAAHKILSAEIAYEHPATRQLDATSQLGRTQQDKKNRVANFTNVHSNCSIGIDVGLKDE